MLRACAETGVAVVPVRRRHQRRRRRRGRCAARHRGRRARPAPPGPARVGRPGVADRDFEAGVRGPAAEALLAPHGLTLGHFPQSYEHATLGGYAATRSAGQASTGYGRFDELVVSLTVQTPRGELVLGRGAAAPPARTCAGCSSAARAPSASITSVVLRVRPVPGREALRGRVLPHLGRGLRGAARDGAGARRPRRRPAVRPGGDPLAARAGRSRRREGRARPGGAARPRLPRRVPARSSAGRAAPTASPPGAGPRCRSPTGTARSSSARPSATAGRRAATTGRTCARTCSTPATSSRRSRRRRPGAPGRHPRGRACGAARGAARRARAVPRQPPVRARGVALLHRPRGP